MSYRFAFGLFVLLPPIVIMTACQAKTGGPQSGVFPNQADRPTLQTGPTPKNTSASQPILTAHSSLTPQAVQVSQVEPANQPPPTLHPEIKKKRIIVFGAHPEDPEFGCGGLIARLTKDGHEVLLAYSTCYRGERKIGDESESEIRRREAAASCKVLGASLHFFDFNHETLMADKATLSIVSSWFKEVKPDIVVTHWPVDAQGNHHVTSSLVWQSYLRDKTWSLYFFEVLNDRQTIAFKPDLFLDIGDVKKIKKEACYCHRSQMLQEFWRDHEDMHKIRGEECGVRYAEAYILAEQLPGRALLPVTFLKKKY